MTTQEYKLLKPEHANLEGEALWNAMEDYMIMNGTPLTNDVFDWQGNLIKVGDDVCFIKIRTGGFFKNAAVMVPNGNGTFTTHKIPDEPDVDCWEIGEYIKIENGLRYTSKLGELTFNQPIGMLTFLMDSKHILAIKGVSDFKPKKLNTI